MFTRYDIPREGGETRRQYNAKFGQAEKNQPVIIPPQARHVWDWFWQLSNRRVSGPEVLSYSEVQAWARMTATPVRPEEVEMLMAMDDAYVAEVREEQRAALEAERSKR